MQARHLVGSIVLLVLFASGCDGKLIAAGNVALAAIPCAMLWVTVNLKKSR